MSPFPKSGQLEENIAVSSRRNNDENGISQRSIIVNNYSLFIQIIT